MKNFYTLILAILGTYFSCSSSPLHLSTVSPEFAQFRTNLYAIGTDGSANLVDGTLTQYDTGYSNNIDGKDARKLSNPGENFGMIRGTTILIVERRHTFQNNDTIFFKMWNMRAIKYKLELVGYNLDTLGRIGVLKDRFLQTETPLSLNDTTIFNFSVTSDSASWAADRFMVIFKTPSLSVIPLTFTSFKAYEQKNLVKIDWTTSNENGIKQFNIEKSVAGDHFTKISDVQANNSTLNNYESADLTPADGYNFYRIQSVSNENQVFYSDTIKIYVGKDEPGLTIFPNPVIGNNFNLRIANRISGTYEIRLMNLLGKTFLKNTIQYTGGIITKNYKIGPIPKGIYKMIIKMPSGEEKVISILF